MLKKLGPPIVSFIILAGALECAVYLEWVSRFILPAPSDVAYTLWVDRSELCVAFGQTTLAALIGLFSSFLVGSLFSIGLSLSSFARRAFLPYAIFFQTVPIIAIAPLLVIWFGFGMPTTTASAFVVSFFPIVASNLLGLQSSETAFLDLFRLYGASTWTKLWKLQIPFALPYVFSGLRIAAGLAVIGAIVGEFIAGGGLGSVVDVARTQQRLDKVFAAVLISTVLGWLVMSVINFISSIFLKNWHASERAEL